MRERAIDVVNGHNPTGALYATVAATLAGVPAIVRTEHSIHYAGRHSGLYAPLLEPLLTARLGAVICVCEAVRLSHASRLRRDASKFITIDNGISDAPRAPRDAARRALELGPDVRVALTVGSLTPQKAQRDLLEAFVLTRAAVPGAVLLVAGSGPLEAELRAQTSRLGLDDAVRFLGPRLDVAELLAASDVFVLSSVREGLSVTLLEAMRAARPVVATRVGGTADVVAERRTGLVVPPSAPAALGEAMTTLLADTATAQRMGAEGRMRFERRYRAERMVENTERLYRDVLAGRRPTVVAGDLDAPAGDMPDGDDSVAVARA
jgi:glycosyltransferase involved in cell wall biosynthesis